MGNAISLSGLTGTRLKCDVIRKYYPFWWKIASGGKSQRYGYPTAIIELNAATGEVFIKDTNETLLGSAGHALDLKVNHFGDPELSTLYLNIVLVEENKACYNHLKNVIARRWPQIPLNEIENSFNERGRIKNSHGVYLFNDSLEDALKKIDKLYYFGNSIYYFDPLRSVSWDAIKKVAGRLGDVFDTGIELLIFLFTSDWFLGRNDFDALPRNPDEKTWSIGEQKTVAEADSLFGDQNWRKHVLCEKSIEYREEIFLETYKKKLHKWFRYVLPMPFNPKEKQVFHLILCSNYDTGVNRTRNAYSSETLNQLYKPDNKSAYKKFVYFHPQTKIGISARKRPLEWRILWQVIKTHEDGICDCECSDLSKIDWSNNLHRILDWLKSKDYLKSFEIEDAWGSSLPRFKLNWEVLEHRLGVQKPKKLSPLTPEDFKKTDMGQFLELIKNWKDVIKNHDNKQK